MDQGLSRWHSVRIVLGMEPTKLNLKAAYSKAIEVATLRDYFAAQALTGMISSPTDWAKALNCNEPMVSIFSNMAYEFADAMIKERDK